jgi:DNA-binding transcriptional ArsR family regulator
MLQQEPPGCRLLKTLDDQALAHVAEYFRALSEPLRLKILNALRDQAHNVGQLTELLDCSQANVSKHLATLTRLGLVERRTRGTAAYYRIADPSVYQLCDLVCGQMAQHYASHAQLLAHAAGAPRPRRR